ncbi:MAG: protein phosphatase 2C domain-containing protein [Lachnospiraceae bacterium]|nr:protein phosphatase 2C domain-containing protein [Lachnospiraceae bacterium]
MGKSMRYLSGIYSDIGISKKVNQDAALIRKAKTKMGEVFFAVVCDGMGGLEKGELASSTVISEMSKWFEQTFPDLLYHDFNFQAIKNSWLQTVSELNSMICDYGEEHGIYLGTTLAALLLVDDAYYICNIGDSRVYHLKDQIRQMTRDQSFIQQEIDMGRMTEEEALHSDQRNVLLQCIGVGNSVMPDFYTGEYEASSTFLLCSDGFRHVISNQEIWENLQPDILTDEKIIEEKLKWLVELVKSRQEEDNITAVLVQAIREDAC